MKKIIYCFCFFTVLILNFIPATAQDISPNVYEMGAYNITSGISLDYRGTSVNGIDGRSDFYAKERYYEAFNYRSGLIVSDIHLFADRKKDQSGLFDEMYLNASGINDAYTNASLRMRSFNGWDFKVDYRRAAYYMDRQDSLWSGMHKFDFHRQILNASLSVDIVKSVSLEVNYNGNGRNGNETYTASPYFYGVSNGSDTKGIESLFGGYSTSNIFWVNAPRNDWTNDFGANLNFKLPEMNTNIVVGGGYRKFNQDIEYSPANGSQGLQSLYYYAGKYIGTDSATQTANANGLIGGNPRNESLYTITWSDKRENKTPYYFGKLTSNLTNWATLVGDVRYESTTGTSVNGGIENGALRTSTLLKDINKLQNYYATTNGTAEMTYKNMLANFLLAFRITNQLQLTANYKYQSVDEASNSNINVSTSSNTLTLGQGSATDFTNFVNRNTASNVSYKSTINTISPQLVYAPLSYLNVRAGLTYIINTPTYKIDTLGTGLPMNLYNTNLSKQTKTTSPYLSIYYRPVDMLKLRAKYELTSNSSFYNSNFAATYQNNVFGTGAYTGAAPQYNRLIPDTKNTFNFSADVDLTKNLFVSMGYKMETSKGNLLPGYDYYNSQLSQASATTTTSPLIMTGDMNLKTKLNSLNANARYMINENSMVQVTVNYTQNHWSIPFTGVSAISDNSGTIGVIIPQGTGPYGNNLTVLIDQNTTDVYFDATLFYSVSNDMKVAAGVSFLNSIGGDVITPDNNQLKTVTSGTSYGITNPRPDDPWVGGPFSTMKLHANLHYQFTRNLGAGIDWQYVSLNEKVQGSYVGFSDFLGNLFRIGINYNL